MRKTLASNIWFCASLSLKALQIKFRVCLRHREGIKWESSSPEFRNWTPILSPHSSVFTTFSLSADGHMARGVSLLLTSQPHREVINCLNLSSKLPENQNGPFCIYLLFYQVASGELSKNSYSNPTSGRDKRKEKVMNYKGIFLIFSLMC